MVLRKQILGGVYAPGNLVPKEDELCERFSVSRTRLMNQNQATYPGRFSFVLVGVGEDVGSLLPSHEQCLVLFC
jgi:hypothetical protein